MYIMKKPKSLFLSEDYETFHSDYVIDYQEIIESEIANIPDKRTKDYKIWKEEINKMIVRCNKLMGLKCYNLIK